MKLRWITVCDKHGIKDTYLQYWNNAIINKINGLWMDIPSIEVKDHELEEANTKEDGAY